MNNYRIKTSLNDDKYIKTFISQSFDFLEILSLSISQEDIYRQYSADYGAVVGRCYANSALGIPNVKVSIFIKIDDSDKEDINISSIYPYESAQGLNSDNIRYNLLPNKSQAICHTPVGIIPDKNNILDNPEMTNIYDKYYKFTTTTNKAGDFMFFGVPTGTHILTMDADLSDIGIFSQRPYDFIEQGSNPNQFESGTKFKSGNNLNLLTHIKSKRIGVTVLPFWGDPELNEVGINRVDLDLGYEIKPCAIFMGSIFGDNEKNSINKNCQPRKKLGYLCETITSEGTIEMIRENIDGNIESFNIDGGRVIDENGAWAFRVPMNLDYVITGENGDLIPTDDPTKGIPTRTNVRFKVSMDETGDVGRIRARAKYLIPHNPKNITEEDYSFDNSTSLKSFRSLYWNKIYTVRNHVARTQGSCGANCGSNRRMIGIKDVDDCIGTKNPFPYNKLDSDFNPVFSILCIIISIILFILNLINKFLSFIYDIKIAGIRPFKSVKCIGVQCNDQTYAPGCSGNQPNGTISTSRDETHECYKVELAEALNVFEFDFYNDWINGTLYSFLLKYKKKKNTKAKFCDMDSSESMYLVNTIFHSDSGPVGLGSDRNKRIDSGIIKEFEGELFYGAYHKSGHLLYATDLYELGAIFDCDWQGKPKINNLLIPTTYQIPPKLNEEPGVSEFANDGSPSGVLFNFSCIKMTVDNNQIYAFRRICEIGVGLDENRDTSLADRFIASNDIETKYVRDVLIYLNHSPILDPTISITSTFEGINYIDYRNIAESSLKQIKGNSLFFYFGTEPGLTALEKMNNKYFSECFVTGVSPFIVTGTVTNVSNIGGSDGTIDVDVIGGTEPFIYDWSNGYSTQDVNNLTTGEYILIVTDFNGDSVRKIFNVREPQPLTADVTKKDLTSFTINNGVISVDPIFGGNQPYSVTITGPSTNLINNNLNTGGTVFNNLGSGTYNLIIRDSSTPNLVLNKNIDLLKPKQLKVTVTGTNSDCFGEKNGTINIVIDSGNPPYVYNTTSPTAMMEIVTVDSGVTQTPFLGTTSDLSSLGPGLYNIHVVDSANQVFDGSITISEPSIQPIMGIRYHDGRTNLYKIISPIVSSDNATNMIFYKNDTPVGQGFFSTPGIFTLLPAGVYFEYGLLVDGDEIFFEDENGCQSEAIIVSVPPRLNIVLDNNRIKLTGIISGANYKLYMNNSLKEVVTYTELPPGITTYTFSTPILGTGFSGDKFYVIEYLDPNNDGIYTESDSSNVITL